jgi:tetratricopeptide (TPR) repeat protein
MLGFYQFVRPLFIVTLIGASPGVAQVPFCPGESRSRINTNACSDPFNVFDIPKVTEQPHPSDPHSPTVTIQQLRHVPPKSAQKDMEKATKAFREGRTEEAVGHLESAIRIDPEFVLARNELALIEFRMDKPYAAIEQLNEATKVDPQLPLLFVNLAIGYMKTGNFVDAEGAARTAAGLDRTRLLTRYLLATSLYYQKKFTEEALQCAMQTRDEYPEAHLFAARIFMDRKNFEGARTEIQAYFNGNWQVPEFTITANNWLAFIAKHEQLEYSSNELP